MTFEELMNRPEQLLLRAVSGSRAYNLTLPGSDTDIKGVFVLPQEELYGLEYTPQVSNASNDEVFFEAGRLIDLLTKNNPNILELLSTPEQSILYRHPLMDLLQPSDFLSRLCFDTFAGYARTQIKKASGLNKKINRSFEPERKSLLEFCYVVVDSRSVLLPKWLSESGLLQENCGLVGIDHFRDTYALFHESQLPFGGTLRGIVSDPSADQVHLSSTPAGVLPLAIMYCNKDAYSVYCKEHKEYWQWVESRNETRYQGTVAHGKSYDAKNMMHTFRLLNMSEEIALHQRVIVHRNDRDFLLRIRSGEFEYEDLIRMADEKIDKIEELYAKSDLPEAPDRAKAEGILVRIRKEFY